MATVRDVFQSKAFLVGALQSVLWIAFGVGLMHFAKSFEKIFKDFGYSELPDMTVAVLTLGHFLICYWYLGLLIIVLWPFVTWAFVQLVSPRPISQELWYVATWTLPFACAGIVAFALHWPLITLITKLQKG